MSPAPLQGYGEIQRAIVALLETARRAVARSINAAMTATYWEIGRRIVEFEQGGAERAAYGEALVERLAKDLTQRFGRGFSRQNLWQMRAFYRAWPAQVICQALSGKSPHFEILQTLSRESKVGTAGWRFLRETDGLSALAEAFPLPWSAYVRLLSVRNELARQFYETEALRGGWSVRQLERQINSQFYERTALSRNRAGRQRRLRLDDTWFRVDLLFFHRRLKCLLVIDLKAGKFSHTDAGQMHLYLNYARQHWAKPGENPPVGLIICATKGVAEAHYALEGLPNKVLAAEYRTVLPDEKLLAEELVRTRRQGGVRPLPGDVP
jgi:hypothetical protein